MTVEQLNKVKWLNRAFHAEEKLKALESLVRRDRERAQRVTVSYEGNDKGKSDGRVNSMEIALTRLADSEEKYGEYKRKYAALRNEIQAEIKKIGDTELEEIMKMHYLDFKDWSAVAKSESCSLRTIRRKHKKSLEKLLTVTP